MYFSRLMLRNARSSSSWNTFRTPYTLHQAIWKIFGDRPEANRDFLYRLDDNHRQPVIYAVSALPPDTTGTIWQVESKAYTPQLFGGMRLAYSLRVNPVRKRAGKRHDVVMDAKRRLREEGQTVRSSQAALVQQEVENWLASRAEALGFSLVGVSVESHRVERFIKPGKSGKVTLTTCDVTGVLRVTDPEPFRCLLFSGIGPAKGFGCGMMMVRRI